MRKIRIIEHISLDSVIQAPGGPERFLKRRGKLILRTPNTSPTTMFMP